MTAVTSDVGSGALTRLLAAVGVAFLVLPLATLVGRVPVSDVVLLLGSSQVRSALWVSLTVSVLSAAFAVLIGTPLSLWLATARERVRVPVRALVLVPMVLPPVVGGAALLFTLGRSGWIGRLLDSGLGVTLPFSTAGAVVAGTFVALPFYVITVESALRAVPAELIEAAATMGARPAQTLRWVLWPAIRPAAAAGAALAWARAVGEFGATVTFAGNLQGRTQTLPLAIFELLQAGDTDAALVVSAILLAVALLVMVTLRGRLLG